MGYSRHVGLLIYLLLGHVQAKVWKTSMRHGNRNLVAVQVKENPVETVGKALDLTAPKVPDVKASEHQQISPTLKPESSKTFFKKDYPHDTRPAVDVLHFQHPYPAVQDSEDYEMDYVKDENSDNGNWHAQEEYDRLRHKLAKEKKEADKALSQEEQAEKTLKELMDQYNRDMEKAKAAETKRQAAKDESDKKPKKEEPAEEGSPPPTTTTPPPSDGIDEASADTKKKMSDLEECQKELAATRERLKKVMDDLEKARARQAESQSALDEARGRESDSEKKQASMRDALKKDQMSHAEAEAAYLKQKAIVEAMEKDLKVLAEKVRAQRDAEDKDGGVYNVVKSDGMRMACLSTAALWLSALCLQAF